MQTKASFRFFAVTFAVMFFIITYTTSSYYAAPKNSIIRIGYVESEEYPAFTKGLTGIGIALKELGLIENFDVTFDENDSRKVWDALSKSNGPQLQFVPEMYFSMKGMDENNYAKFENSDKIDLLLVMGTVAGVYVTQHEQKNDYMVFAAANPIKSGIVKSETERYKSNSYAYIDPSRFQRQIEVAYNMFHFKKLGMVYEDNENAYVYSGIEQAELSAAAHGFEIVKLHVDESRNPADDDRYYTQLKEAYSKLAAQVDALYITTATTQDEKLPWLLEDIYKAGVVTISQVGESQVKNGVVLGVTLDNPSEQGQFVARQIQSYLSGVPINKLEQVYEITPKFFINYDSAKTTGLNIPFKTLLMADEIYRAEALSNVK